MVNLSLGAYTFDNQAPTATTAIINEMLEVGWVVVAAAGNDASCRPIWPAALPDVIGVAAVGPDGPAPFTNYGGWVNACAPGVDIVANIPDCGGIVGGDAHAAADADTPVLEFGHVSLRGRRDVQWSGTSFSTPAVVGAIAREARRIGFGANRASIVAALDEAVYNLIEDPTLGGIPKMGTVVNVS